MTILDDKIPKKLFKNYMIIFTHSIQENTDQKISEYVRFSRSGKQIQGRLPIETSYWDKISKKKQTKQNRF